MNKISISHRMKHEDTRMELPAEPVLRFIGIGYKSEGFFFYFCREYIPCLLCKCLRSSQDRLEDTNTDNRTTQYHTHR